MCIKRLEADRDELTNLAGEAIYSDEVAHWRRRLVQALAERGDGFSDGQRLIARREWWPAEVER